jgi:2-oxoglutarate ferredoxin oxidoreductase subunit gamma
VLAARILGEAAILDGKNALQTQAYGAEARGSLTKSEVIISERRINFPAVRSCDILVAMSQESADLLSKTLKPGGTLIIDSTNVKVVPDVQAPTMCVPVTETVRRELGEAYYANMAMLGVLVRATKVVTRDSVERVIVDRLASKAPGNTRAFQLGFQLPSVLALGPRQ